MEIIAYNNTMETQYVDGWGWMVVNRLDWTYVLGLGWIIEVPSGSIDTFGRFLTVQWQDGQDGDYISPVGAPLINISLPTASYAQMTADCGDAVTSDDYVSSLFGIAQGCQLSVTLYYSGNKPREGFIGFKLQKFLRVRKEEDLYFVDK